MLRDNLGKRHNTSKFHASFKLDLQKLLGTFLVFTQCTAKMKVYNLGLTSVMNGIGECPQRLLASLGVKNALTRIGDISFS